MMLTSIDRLNWELVPFHNGIPKQRGVTEHKGNPSDAHRRASIGAWGVMSTCDSGSASSSSSTPSTYQLPLVEISFSFEREERPEEEGGPLPEVNRTFQVFGPNAKPLPTAPLPGKGLSTSTVSSSSELPSRVIAEPMDPNYVEPEAAESNTSFKYSGRHDHGDLPTLRTDNQHLVDVCAAIKEGEEH